jgi:hypothetical protein
MNRTIAFATICMALSSQLSAQDGSSCAEAIPFLPAGSGIGNEREYTSDTTTATNWMTSFGPLVSPSNDRVYTFLAGPQPLGTLTPLSSNYAFAIYLLTSCNESGTEPVPIGATATLGTPISLAIAVPGTTYYVAVTGTAAGGPGANGTLMFSASFPVELLQFEVD